MAPILLGAGRNLTHGVLVGAGRDRAAGGYSTPFALTDRPGVAETSMGLLVRRSFPHPRANR
jgi:hypothetical protein